MSDGEFTYKKGEIYTSELGGFITNIQGDMEHYWPLDNEYNPSYYFKPLKEVDRVYAYATDRLRELYERYQGDKLGDPSNAKFFDIKLSDNDVIYLCANNRYTNPFITYDYVTEDTFIELIGMNVDQEEDYDDQYNCVVNGMKMEQEVFNPKPYYDNSLGSLYKVATERGWSAYLFDLVKRLERGGKKDPLRQEIEKSIDVLKIWLNEID